jgi:anti-sigma B factor antagonist
MNFDIEKRERFAIVKSNVEKLDTNYAPELKAELVLLDKSGDKNFIIDLTASRYCDSSGLSAILVANRLTKNRGGTLVLFGLQEPVMKLITISQLDSILNIVSNQDEAIGFVQKEEMENKED